MHFINAFFSSSEELTDVIFTLLKTFWHISWQETITKEVIDGVVPFFREKPKDVALTEGEPLQLSCLVASEPKAAIHWLKNDLIFMEDSRYAKIILVKF